MTPVSGDALPTPANSGVPDFDPVGNHLYFANGDSNTISAYAVDSSTGALTSVVGSPYPSSGNADSVHIDASGSFLFATKGPSVPQASYSIDETKGALTRIATAPLTLNPKSGGPAFFLIDSNSSRAYVVAECNPSGADCRIRSTYPLPFVFDLWTFAIDTRSGSMTQTGAPQPLFRLSEFSDLTSVQIDPSGQFICAQGDQGGGLFFYTLDCYPIDPATGTPAAGSPASLASDVQNGSDQPVETWDSITIAR